MNYESLPVRCSNVVEKHICYEGWHYFLNQDEARLKKILEDESNDICLKLYKTALLVQGRNFILDSDMSERIFLPPIPCPTTGCRTGIRYLRAG